MSIYYNEQALFQSWGVDQTGSCANLWISDVLDEDKRIAFSINQQEVFA
jgi:hypothetical protein